MQSKTADFAPAPPLGELDKTCCLWFCRFWQIRSIMWKHDVIHKTGST